MVGYTKVKYLISAEKNRVTAERLNNALVPKALFTVTNTMLGKSKCDTFPT